MRKLSLIPVIAVLAVSSAHTVSAVSITGTVTSSRSGLPLQGVIVKLLAATPLIADTTAANGYYALTGTITSVRETAPNRALANSVYYRNNRFIFIVSAPVAVTVKLYDIRGVLMAAVYDGILKQGRTDVPFTLNDYGHAVYLMKVKSSYDLYGAERISTYKISSMAANTAYSIFEQSMANSQGNTHGNTHGFLGKTAAIVDWLQAAKQRYQSNVRQISSDSGVINIALDSLTGDPNFGPNVIIFDPSQNTTTMQNQLTALYNQQQPAQFGTGRYAYFFKPGQYNLSVLVGFYTEVLGLGLSPDSVRITGEVRSNSFLGGNNSTCNFWRSAAGIAVTPTGGTNQWAVSQGCPFRRMHILGSVVLHQSGGWASGGFMADCKVDGAVNSGSQQQWFSRNDAWGSWTDGAWNMVFVGVTPAPSATWPIHTVVPKTPVIAEKPFIVYNSTTGYSVMVPNLRTDSTLGTSWAGGATPGTLIPIDQFYIALAGTDNAASINAALAQGKNLLVTPGTYHLENTIQVTRPRTIVLGIGFATFVPDNGTMAMKVADVDGVKIGGLLFEGNAINAPVLLQLGDSGTAVSHASNPTFLYDVFCRAGGEFNGLATCFVTINSNDVIYDHAWLWRADHGAGAGWTSNRNANGLIVNGNNVIVYGLFVEHTQEYQTLWNGNNGRTFFYQSEMPYDPPDQASWMRGTINGYPSYKVSNNVTVHEAWGVGIYSVFTNNVTSDNAIEVATAPGVKVHHMVTEKLANGQITHIINGVGGAATATLAEFP